MKIVDFDACERILKLAYGGRAGRKVGVLYKGEPWLIKFPESMKSFPGRDKNNQHLPSYTTSPISEYIGSKIYASLEIPVHEVILGKREGKVVVGCKDFTVNDQLMDFAAIKNTIDEDSLTEGNSSSDRGELLSDALKVIEEAEVFTPFGNDVKKRFWDMFVTDAFILNNDRNNGNWGLLIKPYSMELAPVFDNGNALFNKRNNSLMERRASMEQFVLDDIMNIRSFFKDENDHSIHPFRFIASMTNADCNAAVLRFAKRINMDQINAIIDNMPLQAFDLTVITTEQKDFYKKILKTAAEQNILLVAEKLTQGLNPAI